MAVSFRRAKPDGRICLLFKTGVMMRDASYGFTEQHLWQDVASEAAAEGRICSGFKTVVTVFWLAF